MATSPVTSEMYVVLNLPRTKWINRVPPLPPASRRKRTTSSENPSRRSLTPVVATRPQSSARQTRTPYSASERPMTANKGAGYTPARTQQSKSPILDVESEWPKSEDEEREERIRALENEIQRLIESSTVSASNGDLAQCLHSAKEASSLMQRLTKMLFKGEERSLDLKGSVALCLAIALELNELDQEAAETYKSALSDTDTGLDLFRFRVNLGNLHFRKEEYPAALKMYKMALDRVSETQRSLKAQIMKNIAVTLMKMGRVRQSVEQYEQILEDHLMDLQVASNLCIGYTKLGNVETLKRIFCRMLSEFPNLEGETSLESEDLELSGSLAKINNCILTCGKILASKIDHNEAVIGFDWCINELRKSGFHSLAKEFLFEKANALFHHLKCQDAMDIYKSLIKMDQNVNSKIPRVLASVFLLQDDVVNGRTLADKCVMLDRYSYESWVTKGIGAYKQLELTQARLHFEEAIRLEPESIEALYNLGLVFKTMALEEQHDENLNSQFLQSAYSSFLRLHQLLPENLETLFQLGCICETQLNLEESIKWFEILHSLIPEDASVLEKLGALYFGVDDETKALNYYQESYSMFPCNMEVLCWLAAFYSKNEMFEKAIDYFHRASMLQPEEVKWKLMIASCLRRAGSYSPAYKAYIEIHKNNPQNIECLKFIIQLCEEELTQFHQLNSAKNQIKNSTANEANSTDQSHTRPYNQPLQRQTVESTKPIDDWGHGPLGNDLLPL
eukprot:g1358.t1